MNIDSTITACKNKSLNDQRLLYEYTYKAYFHICMRYSNGQRDAEEIFNSSMFKIFKFLMENSSPITNYPAFCSRIIRLTAIDHYRSLKSHMIYISSEIVDDVSEPYFDDVLNSLEVEDIFKMIQTLPDKERIVFCMFEVDGFSHKEIGLDLDIKENHSKWLLHHAKKMLKEKLNHYGIKSARI
ncbi:MAG: RNA polymerase sigma factor [Saprospiraceae bacterium]